MTRRRALALVVLALVGVGFSVAALVNHYGTGSSYCDVSATLSCDVVNRGSYSEVAGIPVAAIGVVGYLVLAALVLAQQRRPTETGRQLLVLGTLTALAFSLYLTGLEAFVIRVFCPLCLGSQLTILTITALVLWRPRTTPR